MFWHWKNNAKFHNHINQCWQKNYTFEFNNFDFYTLWSMIVDRLRHCCSIQRSSISRWKKLATLDSTWISKIHIKSVKTKSVIIPCIIIRCGYVSRTFYLSIKLPPSNFLKVLIVVEVVVSNTGKISSFGFLWRRRKPLLFWHRLLVLSILAHLCSTLVIIFLVNSLDTQCGRS